MRLSLFSILILSCSLTFGRAVVRKATKTSGGPLYSVELVAQVSQTPRSELESKISMDKDVQACLRTTLLNVGDDFKVEISGQVEPTGALTGIAVDCIYPNLKSCLPMAVGQLKLDSGAEGPFKMEISKLRITGTHVKTFLLDLNEPKKMQ